MGLPLLGSQALVQQPRDQYGAACLWQSSKNQGRPGFWLAKRRGQEGRGCLMVQWTHRSCEACWRINNPEREPVRVLGEGPGRCCFCGGPAREPDAIWVRQDPETLVCAGWHGEDC